MYETAFLELVNRIRGKDPRYDREAYAFVREALDFVSKQLRKPQEGAGRHITGQELLEGIRQFALQEFGPAAVTVFKAWGLSRTEDFGEIVFNLVEAGCLGRTESDSKADFANGYDFGAAFAEPYLPAANRQQRAAARREAGAVRRAARRGATGAQEE